MYPGPAPAAAPRRALALLLALALAAPALASDEVGLFFDDRGETTCAQAAPYSTIGAWLLLLEPSAGSVSGWECELECENAMLTGTVLAGSALNVVAPPRFQVGIGSPLGGGSVVQLAQFTFLLMGSSASFSLLAFDPPSLDGATTPVYADGADPSHLIAMTPRGLTGGSLVAGVNLPECVTEDATWGRIKNIYDR